MLVDAGPVRNQTDAAAVRRIGRRRYGHDRPVAVARADELARVADRRDQGDVHVRAVRAARVERELVFVDAEGARPVRPLVQLDHDVARHLQQRSGGAFRETERNVVLPLDFVPDMVRGQRQPERQISHFLIEIRAARIAAVLVAERAPRRRIDGRVPGRIE